MKWAPAVLLLSLALAGCTAGDDDPAPPNADPYPSESYPALSSTSSTTTPPPNPSGSGSVTPSSSSAPPTAQGRFGPHDGEDSATDADFPGLMLGGRLAGSGASVSVAASANNFGERGYRVPGGCRTPWAESMSGPSGAVALRQPAAACAAESWGDLAAHDSLSRTFEWNGTLWDAGSGTFAPAPPGTYAWRIVFDVYSGSGSPPPEHAALEMEFQVTVG
jgi:hypothetical protein